MLCGVSLVINLPVNIAQDFTLLREWAFFGESDRLIGLFFGFHINVFNLGFGAIDLYQAENGRYPASYDEFMTEIIKANNIALPRLPPYQAYGYDEKEHKLILLEYPDKK